MARQELHTEDLLTRLLTAGSEILAMNTGLSKEAAFSAIVAAARQAFPSFGLQGFPGSELPLEVRYRLVKQTLEILGADLRGRDFPPQVVNHALHDLDAFYRGVRGITE